MRQGYEGYYDSSTEEGMCGFEFIGDPITDAANAAADAVARAVQPTPAQAPVVVEDNTLRNVGIGAGGLLLAFLAYRHFR